MKPPTILSLLLAIIIISCNQSPQKPNINDSGWTEQKLKIRSAQHMDTTLWDTDLFNQDLTTYIKHKEIFQSFPLNKSPFPVATYDYAVGSIPFSITVDSTVFKGIHIGEYANFESDDLNIKLTLLIQADGKFIDENTLVESRNYPYLTAQGTFNFTNNHYDWIFTSNPDGCSTLLLNMKRFGETIIIYPQDDLSFYYDQIEDSVNLYDNKEEYQSKLISIIKRLPAKHSL